MEQDWFIDVATILRFMREGFFEFKGVTVPDLATAIEEMEPLYLDRFGRLKKASDEQKSLLLEELAEYFKAIPARTGPWYKLGPWYRGEVVAAQELLMDSGNTERYEATMAELWARQQKEHPAPPPESGGRIGWMSESLPSILGAIKTPTSMAITPQMRKALIEKRVNEGHAAGIAKEEIYKTIAAEQNVKPGTIKDIYLRK